MPATSEAATNSPTPTPPEVLDPAPSSGASMSLSPVLPQGAAVPSASLQPPGYGTVSSATGETSSVRSIPQAARAPSSPASTAETTHPQVVGALPGGYMSCQIQAVLGNLHTSVTVDTGAAANIIDRATLERVVGVAPTLEPPASTDLVTANKEPLKILGRLSIEVTLGGITKKTVFSVVEELACPPILGTPALKDFEATINFKKERLVTHGQHLQLRYRRHSRYDPIPVVVPEALTVPRWCRMKFEVEVQLKEHSPPYQEGFLQPHGPRELPAGFRFEKAIVGPGRRLQYGCLNASDVAVELRAGTCVASLIPRMEQGVYTVFTEGGDPATPPTTTTTTLPRVAAVAAAVPIPPVAAGGQREGAPAPAAPAVDNVECRGSRADLYAALPLGCATRAGESNAETENAPRNAGSPAPIPGNERELLEYLDSAVQDLMGPRFFSSARDSATIATALPAVAPQHDPVSLFMDRAAPPETRSPEVLREMILKKVQEASVSAEDARRLQGLLDKYMTVFAPTLGTPGLSKHEPHHIRLEEGTAPIKSGPRPVSEQMQAAMDKELGKLLANGSIRESFSPWAAPVVMVPKADGEWRFCVDYRRLNAVTKKEAYPLPRIEDLTNAVKGAQWFSTMDLASGFHQVIMAEEDCEKTAFVTNSKRYSRLMEWVVCPMGLSNAPVTFQRNMDVWFSGLSWECCVVYIDDILIYSASFEQHLLDLEKVLQRLQQARLVVKIGKCKFAQREVKALGNIVSAKGVSPDPEKIRAIREAAAPTDVKQLQRVLGLFNYYRRFVKGYAGFAVPLYQLMKEDTPWRWGSEEQAAYDALKEAICKAPTLAYPDSARECILTTDASDVAIGAVLSQLQPDPSDSARLVERPIAFGSRVLTAAERNYSTTEREYLAIVWFAKEWYPLLQGRHFTIYTDHRPLEGTVRQRHNTMGRLARWALTMQEFDCTITYKPGKLNVVADALSREPVASAAAEPAVVAAAVNEEGVGPEGLPVDLAARQRADPELGPIVQYLEDGGLPEDGKAASRIVNRVQSLGLFLAGDGRLTAPGERVLGYAGDISPPQVAVPRELRGEVLERYHDRLGHFGAEATLERVRARFWWPGMSTDVKQYCRSCDSCQRGDRRQASRYGLTRPAAAATAPFQAVSLDVVGPLEEASDGSRVILTITDMATRWAMAIPMKNQKAETIAWAIYNHWLCLFAAPGRLHSDRGRNLNLSEVEKVMARLWGYELTTTPAYHPQANPDERFNQTLVSHLRVLVGTNPKDWPLHLPQLVLAYNTRVCRATGFSPYEMLFLHKAKLPMDARGHEDVGTPTSWVETLKARWAEMKHVAARKQAELHRENERTYNEGRLLAPFQRGDHVRVARLQHGKLGQRWSGPWVVIEREEKEDGNAVLFRVQNLQNPRRIETVPARRMLYYQLRECPELGPGEFEIERILGRRQRGGKRQYQVRFVDWSGRHDQWIDEDQLNASSLLEEFERVEFRREVSRIANDSTADEVPPDAGAFQLPPPDARAPSWAELPFHEAGSPRPGAPLSPPSPAPAAAARVPSTPPVPGTPAQMASPARPPTPATRTYGSSGPPRKGQRRYGLRAKVQPKKLFTMEM